MRIESRCLKVSWRLLRVYTLLSRLWSLESPTLLGLAYFLSITLIPHQLPSRRPLHLSSPIPTLRRDMCEWIASGLELEAVTKRNPVPQQNAGIGGERVCQIWHGSTPCCHPLLTSACLTQPPTMGCSRAPNTIFVVETEVGIAWCALTIKNVALGPFRIPDVGFIKGIDHLRM